MPPKAKKKRASLKLDAMSGQVQESDVVEKEQGEEDKPTVRQVVEVVEEGTVPEAIETIKKDTEEIEEAVEAIEEEVREENSSQDEPEPAPTSLMREEVAGDSKKNVESLFVKSESGVNPEITVVGKRGPSLGVWVGAMLGVALAIGVSLIILVKGPSTLPFMAVKPTLTPTPTIAPTPASPTTAVVRTDVKVRVINGGGTPGAGSKMKTFLEGKGYTVASVANADAYTYTKTEVSVKSGKKDLAKLLADDLKADYTLGTASAVVAESASYEAEVIVGKEE